MPSRRWRDWGGTIGTLFAGFDMWLNFLKLRTPWTLKHQADHTQIGRKEHYQPIDYPKPDGKLTFDRLSIGVHFEHQS